MSHERDASAFLGHASGSPVYRAVVSAISEGVVIFDADGRIVEVNPAAERILGVPAEHMTRWGPGEPAWEAVLPDGTRASPDEIPTRMTLRTGLPCRGHRLGVVRPSGERVWLRLNTDPVHGDDGTLRLVVATFTDISESIEAKAELETSRGHLKHIVDVAPGVFYQAILDPDGVVSIPFLSERVQTMIGVSATDAQARPVQLGLHLHPDDAPLVLSAVLASGRQLTPLALDVRVRKLGGEWFWIRTHAIPSRVDQGVLWTGMVLDVTQEHAVAERLRRAARREAMGEMAAGLAHNFNNLLASILPNIELALVDGTEREPLLTDALQASRSAADLVRQLLAFTRSETHETVMRTVELTAVVRDMLRFCRRTFDSRIRMDVKIPDDPIYVLGQVSNLQQVVMNLCLNARDAMARASEPLLTVELRAVDEGAGTQAELTVSDNGVGMDAETVKRLGEPFFTTKAAGLGTGLGMATVHGIVRDSGGIIRCASEPGQGTRFEVRFPCRLTVDDASTEEPTPANRPHKTGLVMLVDDERLVRTALRRQLGTAGFQTVEAASGDEALLMMATMARLPDAILLDLSMPGMSGEEVLAELVLRWPQIPVVVVSGNRGPSQVLDGARTVLRKPVDRATLLGVLESVLGP